MASAIEKKVDQLKKLRAELNGLESGMRQMRLGAAHEYRFKRIFWREMGYGGGWFANKAEPMQEGIENKFYDFLAEEARKLGTQISGIEAVLAATDKEEGH